MNATEILAMFDHFLFYKAAFRNQTFFQNLTNDFLRSMDTHRLFFFLSCSTDREILPQYQSQNNDNNNTFLSTAAVIGIMEWEFPYIC
mgnify:CR=1 FL=1